MLPTTSSRHRYLASLFNDFTLCRAQGGLLPRLGCSLRSGGKPTLPLGAGERSRLHTGRFAWLTCQTLSYNNCHSNCWQQCWKNPGSVPEFLPYSWSFRFLCREIKGDARRYGRRLGGGKEGRQKGNMGGLFSHQNF